MRQLLERYLDQRLLFYTTRDAAQLAVIDNETAKLQTRMWAIVQSATKTQQAPTVALAVAGMNDVLNRQGYTQAAWWNQIPVGAWGLMGILAVCCCLLTGYGAHRKGVLLYTTLPFLVSIAFFLIADIDSPRRGVIRVIPQNLISLSQSMRGAARELLPSCHSVLLDQTRQILAIARHPHEIAHHFGMNELEVRAAERLRERMRRIWPH